MSIFGKLDAANIPTNPFFIKQGEYGAEVTEAQFKTNRDQQRQIYIQYTISDEGPYKGMKANQYFNLVDENMTDEMFDLLPADEQKTIRRNNANLKKTLCGSDGNDKQPGLGVSIDDINSADWDPKSLVGTPVNLAIGNYGDNKVQVNWVNIIQE